MLMRVSGLPKRNPMAARPRQQRGWVRKVGPSWIGFYYAYEVRDGVSKRVGPKEKKIGAAVAMTKTEAKAWFQGFLDRTVNNPEAMPVQPTMAELWAIHSVRYERTEPGSKRTMRGLWTKHLEPVFGAELVSRVTKADIEAFFDETEIKYSGKVKMRGILKQLFNLAIRHGAAKYSPIEDAYLRFDNDEFAGTLGVSEVRAIRAKLPNALTVLQFDVLWNLGVSRSEFLALRCDDVTVEGVTIDEKVFEGRAGRVKTFRRKGTIPCHADLLGRLIRHRDGILAQAGGNQRAWLWPRPTGTGPMDPDQFTDALRVAAVKAGVTARVDFRVMRRTFGTLAADAKGVASSSGVLRNSAATAAKHYAKAADEAKLDTVAAVFGAVMGEGTVVQ